MILYDFLTEKKSGMSNKREISSPALFSVLLYLSRSPPLPPPFSTTSALPSSFPLPYKLATRVECHFSAQNATVRKINIKANSIPMLKVSSSGAAPT